MMTVITYLRCSCWTERSARREITHSLQGRWRHSSITFIQLHQEEEAQRVERYIFKVFGIRATFEMTDILNIKDEPIFDDRIVKIETPTYPFANVRIQREEYL